MTTLRTALPCLVAGALGFLSGLASLVLDAPVLAAVAGIAALAAGFAGWSVAKRLDEQAALQALVEAELQAVRGDLTDAATARRLEAVETGSSTADADGVAEPDEALLDPNTGLFSESFFSVALESRIAAARRHLRPVAMVLVEVVRGLPERADPVDADLVADTVKQTLREADTACRLRNGYFALLLEDTPENGAIWTVERIRRQLVEADERLTIWAGIACYPAHAFGSSEIMDAAERALVSAREWRQDRIEVAAAAD
ncbi:MAG: diguanylate cyclase domain-containing protein [Acidimicrobiales bacterium]